MTLRLGHAPAARGVCAGRIRVVGAWRIRASIHCLLVGVTIIMLSGLAGCASAQTRGVVVNVNQALAGSEGQLIGVQGQVVATESQVVLASALLESYPPQAGGAVLQVKGLELTALVGLKSTAAQSGMAEVTWSDHPVVLEGKVKGGVLEVKTLPRVVEGVTAEVKVRFSPPSEPIAAGGLVWWIFDVTNVTASPLDLTFANGQTAEVVLTQGGEEKYRWSDGKAFIEQIRVDTVEPGRKVSYVFNDVLQVEPGDYRLTAKVTASVGPEGTAAGLPEVATTITVR